MSRRAPKRPTAALIAEATRYLKAGVPVETTAKLLLGTRWDEFFAWIAAGHGQHPTLLRRKPYTTLADAVERALAECEARHAAIVQKEGSPKWSAWFLSRRYPDRWAAADHTEVTVTVPHQTRTGATLMIPEGLAASLRALRSEPYTDPRQLPEGDEPELPEPKPLDDGVYIDPSRRPPVIVDTEARRLDRIDATCDTIDRSDIKSGRGPQDG